ncbi:Kch1p [Sugiyamaella lignohabitans]|uniref:Kch1p n=1 Tax=Sugiyamaella lignohabitans TaxID=796027 RepID=A0A167EAQ3_9ASCO|nr:Kch1p [Sugiyamaella lignohabitans]ANB13844.1 Kch1p [Sugiyamaella lignohabitans]
MYVGILLAIAAFASDIYTGIVLLAFDRWSSTIEPYVPFRISRWLFGGCIILSVLLFIYDFIVAYTTIRTKNISLNYTDPIARNVYSIRGYRYFCLFAKLTKSRSLTEYVALFVYFSFKGWIRLIFADSPRQVLNALTLYSVLQIQGNFVSTIKKLAQNSTVEAVVIGFMAFSLLVWVVNIIQFGLALICAVPIYIHIGDQASGLEEYCCVKVNKRIARLVEKYHRKGMKELAEANKKLEKQPSLPRVDTSTLDSHSRYNEKASYSFDQLSSLQPSSSLKQDTFGPGPRTRPGEQPYRNRAGVYRNQSAPRSQTQPQLQPRANKNDTLYREYPVNTPDLGASTTSVDSISGGITGGGGYGYDSTENDNAPLLDQNARTKTPAPVLPRNNTSQTNIYNRRPSVPPKGANLSTPRENFVPNQSNRNANPYQTQQPNTNSNPFPTNQFNPNVNQYQNNGQKPYRNMATNTRVQQPYQPSNVAPTGMSNYSQAPSFGTQPNFPNTVQTSDQSQTGLQDYDGRPPRPDPYRLVPFPDPNAERQRPTPYPVDGRSLTSTPFNTTNPLSSYPANISQGPVVPQGMELRSVPQQPVVVVDQPRPLVKQKSLPIQTQIPPKSVSRQKTMPAAIPVNKEMPMSRKSTLLPDEIEHREPKLPFSSVPDTNLPSSRGSKLEPSDLEFREPKLPFTSTVENDPSSDESDADTFDFGKPELSAHLRRQLSAETKPSPEELKSREPKLPFESTSEENHSTTDHKTAADLRKSKLSPTELQFREPKLPNLQDRNPFRQSTSSLSDAEEDLIVYSNDEISSPEQPPPFGHDNHPRGPSPVSFVFQPNAPPKAAARLRQPTIPKITFEDTSSPASQQSGRPSPFY